MVELPKIKNTVFISYAGEDRDLAQKLCDEINDQIGEYYQTELVENTREGDTTFTEKIINYFKKCNVFIVFLTRNSLTNQFVNQEWGYAKSLKELGQIQIIKHITEKVTSDEIADDFDKDTGRIKSRGFIANNMEFIDLIRKKGKYDSESCIKDVITFLRDKKDSLSAALTEVQEKLLRFYEENKSNIELLEHLESGKEHYVPQEIYDRHVTLRNQGNTEWDQLSMGEKTIIRNGGLWIKKEEFSYDFALHIIDISYLIPNKEFIKKVIEYMSVGKKLNVHKDFCNSWCVSRGKFNFGEVGNYYRSLTSARNISEEMDLLISQELARFK